MNRTVYRVLATLVVAAATSAAAQPQPANQEAQSVPVINHPDPDIGEGSLDARAAAQRWTQDQILVPVDFRFSDQRAASGIDFRHRIPEEGGKNWMPVHYDHGSCVVAADVDGDRLLDLYFVSLVGSNQLWRNRGDGTFENITDQAGVAVSDRVSMAASFADADNDGDPDLFVTSVRRGNLWFVNDGKGRFTESAVEAGLGHHAHSSTGNFFDYDRDGRLDLLLTNVGQFTTLEERPNGAYRGMPDAFQGHLQPDRSEAHVLYRNLDGRHFSDVSQQLGFVDSSWSGDSSALDLSGDSYPDFYLTNMQGDDRYWESQGGESYVERSAELFPKTPWGTMGIKFFDYDNDGDFDLLLTDMHSDMSQEVPPEEENLKSKMLWSEAQLQGGANNIFGNAFYQNLGDGRFQESSDAMGLENFWPWGVSIADLNADGFLDVLITASMSYPFRYGINSLLLNNRARGFVNAEFLVGIEPREITKTPWFEVDCGGTQGEVALPATDVDHPACTGRSGHAIVYGSVGTRGSVMLDLDNDGDLDIVTNEFNTLPQILISDLAQRHQLHWLKVRLRGTTSNRDGLGAKVSVVVGDTTYTQLHDGKSGYMAQSSLPLYFGLGDAVAADRIEILWPSGAIQTLHEGLSANQTLDIIEPAADHSEAKVPKVP